MYTSPAKILLFFKMALSILYKSPLFTCLPGNVFLSLSSLLYAQAWTSLVVGEGEWEG
jgi:hypothetical protein